MCVAKKKRNTLYMDTIWEKNLIFCMIYIRCGAFVVSQSVCFSVLVPYMPKNKDRQPLATNNEGSISIFWTGQKRRSQIGLWEWIGLDG